jgi:hypothetical protein
VLVGGNDSDQDPVHPAYNPYLLAYFFSRNSIFLSQQINQQCFSADLSAQPPIHRRTAGKKNCRYQKYTDMA